MPGLISLATVLYFAVANTGSLGTGSCVTKGNKTVRRKLLNRLRGATKSFGNIDALLVQESGFNDFLAAPFFNGPISSNRNFSYQNFNPRGVCTYACNADAFIDPSNTSEISASIHPFNYKNSRNRVRRCDLGLLNIYRNHGQCVDDLVCQIQAMMNKMSVEQGIKKFVCTGDFNAEEVEIPGLQEFTHPLLSHLHNNSSEPTFIDKVFSNLKEIDVVRVDDSVENKGNGLGHKFYIIKVGMEMLKPGFTTSSFIKQSRLRKAAKQISSSRLTEENWSQGSIDERAADLQDIFSDIINDAKVERFQNPNKKPKIVTLEDIESKIESTDKDVQNHFYKFVDMFRNKKSSDVSNNRPDLNQFIDVLEKKFQGLNQPDYSLVRAITEEAHNEVGARDFWAKKKAISLSHRRTWKKRPSQPAAGPDATSSFIPAYPSFNNFKKLVLSLSNSNAADIYELSTKNLKTIVNYNNGILRAIYFLCRRIFKEGKMPLCLKKDKIGFLYKRKGSRAVAKNYRPITIASTLGKIVEKVLAAELDRVNDGNPWNHAYKKSKSTQSAVINAIETVNLCRREAKRLESKGRKAAVIIMAEDISSAFESVDGEIICNYLAPFDTNPDFQMANVTRSYLDRDALVVEDGQSGQVKNPNKSRSTPQGSILSCRYWRIFDGLATRAFMNAVTEFVRITTHVEALHHISYADDHLSIILVSWPSDDTTDSNPPPIISHSLLTIRKFFDISTEAIGCGMNAAKSEIITDLQLPIIKKEDFSDEFIWLGYSLSIKDNQLFFDSSKFSSKKNEIRQYVREIFQYAPDLYVRRKIFMVYIAPIIDYFLPTIIMDNQNKASDLELFQKEILKRVLGVPSSCPGNQVEKVLGIDSVQSRLRKACVRYRKFIISDLASQPAAGMRTRSDKNNRIVNKDIASRICWQADLFKFNKQKKKFDSSFAKNWSKSTNERLKKFVAVSRI